MPGEERYYINDTGCGNTVNLSHPRVLQMVMDSLRYWTDSYGVDGFRFDLGVTLGREGTGFDPGSGYFDALLQDPVWATTRPGWRNGTTATATRCGAIGAAMKACAATWPPGYAVRATSSTGAIAALGPASTS
ncbi:hypothetical protein G6F59_015207 [Rhizopus arrhizus]|nr:hypothetical protein G6F59_015207 [Rhizopus arrhizus]